MKYLKSYSTGYAIVIVLAVLTLSAEASFACTSAIVSGRLTRDGRPLLWKNRDTSDLNNKVEKIPATDGCYAYVALYNGTDTLCREAWAGFNSCGFAVMNTASYNLKNDTVSLMDREGIVMSEALATCRTVDDFEALLCRLPKPLGVEANFGVIDALGGAAYFETGNYTYTRFDVSDTADGYIVRTNYSRSGRLDEGYGYIREQNAEYLLAPYIEGKNVSPEVFTEVLSRSFYHSLIGKDFSQDTVTWVIDRDFIPRYSSSASVVIEGVLPGENPELTTMWTVLGYPPCGVMEPVWLWSDTLPTVDESNRQKALVFPIKKDRGENYLNLKVLINSDGTGISQTNRAKSLENYRKGYEILKNKRKEIAE